MPTVTTYPGVYIEELRSGSRTLTGVATSVTAFVGYTLRGIDHRAKRVLSFADFERAFGGLARDSELSYAVKQFYDNSGGEAWVVRVPKHDAKVAQITLKDDISGGKKALLVSAISSGKWGNALLVDVDHDGASDTDSYNLTVTNPDTGEQERFEVSQDAAANNNVAAVINDEDNGSAIIAVEVPAGGAGRPAQTGTVGDDITTALNSANFNKGAVKITSSLPTGPVPITDLPVTIFEDSDAVPTTIPGLCGVLERRLNAALSKKLPGAAVRCVPSSSGKGVRVIAAFDHEVLADAADTVITFTTAAANDITAKLKLDGAANVAHYAVGLGKATAAQTVPVAGDDGTGLPETDDLIGKQGTSPEGIFALDKVDLFNLLCIPDATRAKSGDPFALDANLKPGDIFKEALAYCKKRRAFLLIDPPPEIRDVDKAADWKSEDLSNLAEPTYAAAYFPRLRLSDPLDDFNLRSFAPCGVVAGLYARTDGSRGVWKAPAGTEATLAGVQSLVYRLNDAENGVLNPRGLNCFRVFPVYGHVAWGARTLAGDDAVGSEWKYVPVRRTALFLEESLYRGTKWAVFEPNDEPLWSQLRLTIGGFMNNLFRQGAFAGRTAREAYLVKCDRETTTQDDVDRGVVNILVAFAPLKPAEFVIIKIQQLAGQVQT